MTTNDVKHTQVNGLTAQTNPVLVPADPRVMWPQWGYAQRHAYLKGSLSAVSYVSKGYGAPLDHNEAPARSMPGEFKVHRTAQEKAVIGSFASASRLRTSPWKLEMMQEPRAPLLA